MLLAMLAVASVSAWVPARWHSHDVKTLELLAGTPVNCLLLETADWDPAFIRAAQSRGVAILGILPGETSVERAAGMKFDAVVAEADPVAETASAARKAGLFTIALPKRAGMTFDKADRISGTSQGLWPGVEVEHGGKVVLGPTSSPWIYTNAGFLRFARALTEGELWVGVRPPPGTIFPAVRYAQAIGDAALVGARWVLALDADLERRLYQRDPAALADWKRIAAYLAYFENHPEWRAYRAYSRMAVVQDTGSGGLLSSGLLDMLASQRTGVRAVPSRRLTSDSLKDVRVVLDVDPDALSQEQKTALENFARGGGTVIHPPAQWKFPQSKPDQIVLERRQADQLASLWELTYNATVRKNFGARTFNTTGILSSVLAAPGGKSVLVHLLNFLDFPGESITVHVLGKWQHARFYQLDAEPVELPVFDVPEGTGVEIGKLITMGTIRMD